jgi:hypothetical protein
MLTYLRWQSQYTRKNLTTCQQDGEYLNIESGFEPALEPGLESRTRADRLRFNDVMLFWQMETSIFADTDILCHSTKFKDDIMTVVLLN